MNISFKNYKRIWYLVATVYFAGGYLLCNWLNMARTRYYNVSLPFEKDIPFVPLFILGYILVYFSMLALYFIITDENVFKKTLKAFFMLTTLHYFIFILIPVQMTMRPNVSMESGFLNVLVKFYYWIDMPYNCFPSLHVAYTALGLFVLWNYKRPWRYLYLATSIIVSISVMLVKQHYVLDVVGGYLSAFFVYWLIFRTTSQPVESTCRSGQNFQQSD